MANNYSGHTPIAVVRRKLDELCRRFAANVGHEEAEVEHGTDDAAKGRG